MNDTQLVYFLDLYKKHSGIRKAAEEAGMSKSNFHRYIDQARDKGLAPSKPRYQVRANGDIEQVTPRSIEDEMRKQAAQQGFAPDFDLTHPVPDGLALRGTSILYDKAGKVDKVWNKTRIAGRDPQEAFNLEGPKHVTKISTNYDQRGEIITQWVSEEPTAAAKGHLWQEFAASLKEDLPRVEFSVGPTSSNDDTLVVYPFGDLHFGLMSWKEETGVDYNLKMSEELFNNAISYLINAAPNSTNAVLAFMGDQLHIDSFEAVTPAHRNLLDADSRFPKIVRTMIRAMRYSIELAKAKHPKVHVIVELGNHDISSSIFLAECLANVYENDTRVTIDTSPMHYHYYRFGSNLIGTHHGHGVKMDRLPLIMANDRPEDWGATRHRTWFTGHIHNAKTLEQDFAGCRVESLRILAAPDAYSAQKGYRSMRDMKSIVFHTKFGEVSRNTVNPQMFEVE